MKINIASTRLAFFLIAGILFLILLSAIIPQDDFSSGQIIDLRESLGENYTIIETLQLDRIYYNPLFFVILGLLAINLTAGNIRRFRLVYKNEKTLFKLRTIGSILFHFSLLLIIISIVLNFLYKKETVFALTEGQLIADSSSDYFRRFNGPLADGKDTGFSIRMDKINQISNEDNDPGGEAEISLGWVGGEIKPSGKLSSNHPVVWGGYEFHYGVVTGYSPELTLYNLNDSLIFRSFVRVTKRTIDGQDIHSDFIILQERNLKLAVKIFPPGDTTESLKYGLFISQGEELLVSDTVMISDQIIFDGYKLSVSRIRYWCYIGAIKNPFINWIFLGFWSAITGLSLGFLARMKGEGKNR